MWDFARRQKLAACVLLLALAAGGVMLLARRAISPPLIVYPHSVSASGATMESRGQTVGSDGNSDGERDAACKSEEEPDDLVVHVCGAVKNPGVYILQKDARVADAVGLAGGLDDSAVEEAVNMAMRLQDSMQIYIPCISSVSVPDTGGAHVVAGTPGSGKININTATRSQLQGLPGIGPALSERILEFRTAGGRFEQPDDLMKISGIGEKKYADLKDLVTVH
jgi:competence protein ComEA